MPRLLEHYLKLSEGRHKEMLIQAEDDWLESMEPKWNDRLEAGQDEDTVASAGVDAFMNKFYPNEQSSEKRHVMLGDIKARLKSPISYKVGLDEIVNEIKEELGLKSDD